MTAPRSATSLHRIAAAAVVAAAAGLAHAQAGAIQAIVTDAAGNVAPERYVEIPGSMEFSGSMIVRPKQALFGNEAARFAGGGLVAGRGVDIQAMSDARTRLMPTVIEHFADVDEYVVAVPAGMNENTFAEQLLATGDYEYAEPNWTVYTANVPNDPQYNLQWHHDNVNSEGAWAIETGSSDIIIAIVDTGSDIEHPDLDDLLVPGFNAVDNLTELNGGIVDDTQTSFGHGTFCAGMATAEGNNGFGTAGIAWGASLMPIKVTIGNNRTASSADLNQGARWAADNGARIVNVSFSGVASSSVQTTGAYVEDRGGVYFRSAGNDGQASLNFEHPNVVVVGATNINDNRASFSNWGPGLDSTGPGDSVRCASRGGGSRVSSGTSFSTPLVAGVAALMLSKNPSLSPAQVRDILFSTTIDIGATGDDDIFGSGLVNAAAAVATAGAPPLDVAILSPAATVVAPGVATVPTFVEITDNGDTIIDGPFLNIRKQGETNFQQIALNETIPNLFELVIPAQLCGDDPEYFVSVESQNAGVQTLPESGTFQAVVVSSVTEIASDNAETDLGYTVSGDASDGQWTRGVPSNNGRGDPATDFDGSGSAWVTDNSSADGGNSDVDNGTTILTSPAFDVPAGADISYAYWFNDFAGGTIQGGDSFTVSVSTDNGASFTAVRTVTNPSNAWRTDTLVEGVDFNASSQLVLRFAASDIGTQNVIEAAVARVEAAPAARGPRDDLRRRLCSTWSTAISPPSMRSRSPSASARTPAGATTPPTSTATGT